MGTVINSNEKMKSLYNLSMIRFIKMSPYPLSNSAAAFLFTLLWCA